MLLYLGGNKMINQEPFRDMLLNLSESLRFDKDSNYLDENGDLKKKLITMWYEHIKEDIEGDWVLPKIEQKIVKGDTWFPSLARIYDISTGFKGYPSPEEQKALERQVAKAREVKCDDGLDNIPKHSDGKLKLPFSGQHNDGKKEEMCPNGCKHPVSNCMCERKKELADQVEEARKKHNRLAL